MQHKNNPGSVIGVKFWIILVHLSLVALLVEGQQDTIKIRSNCDGILFSSFSDTISKYNPVKFFYDPQWISYVRISQGNDNRLDKVLARSLAGKNIFFVRDNAGNYIFTKDFVILTGLSEKIAGPEKQAIQDTLSLAGRKETQVDQTPVTDMKSKGEMILLGNAMAKTTQATISGFVTDELNGEPVIGAIVLVQDLQQATMSDASGYYILTIPSGRHTVNLHSLGMKDATFQVMVYSDCNFTIKMGEKITQLKDVTVVADRGNNISSLKMGFEKLDMKTIKQLPSSLGEVDIVKVALLLPGVQTVGEGASGFNVRGGSTDQNLFILNGAPVFNTSHLFGFFSVFNPDVIRDFELYKSGIPAQYGGRISSVFDVQTKSGNRKKYSVSGGISPVAMRIMVDGPILRDKLSFVLGIRSTYSDWILRQINRPEIKNSKGSFYDINGKISYEINQKNTIELSAYGSYDFFKLNFDTSYAYNSRCATLLWKHHFNTKLIGVFSGISSFYSYQVESSRDPASAFRMDYKVNYREIKADLSYYPAAKHKITFGGGNIWYNLQPGNLSPVGNASAISKTVLETEHALETSFYVADQFDISSRLSLYAGFRGVLYNFLGPKTVYGYFKEGPVNGSTLEDTISYSKGKVIQTYFGLEPRISLRYSITPVSSFKISYNRLSQYLNMMSNTTAVSPTDTWKLSDSHIRPQTGDQYSIGYYFDFRKNTIETSAEVYYKDLKRIIDYKGGARLLMNDKIETDLVEGRGKAYGIEFMVKKPMGKMNGWISYTYSRVFYKVDGSSEEEKINDGDFFPANHDKPHDFSLVQNYRFSRRFSISNNLVYSTGRPITYPVGKWGNDLLYYSKRNEYRIPDYFRWDFSANLDGNLKSKKLAHGSWSLSVYNVTGRFNVYSVYFKSSQGQVKGYMLSVFSKPLITLSYNFRF